MQTKVMHASLAAPDAGYLVDGVRCASYHWCVRGKEIRLHCNSNKKLKQRSNLFYVIHVLGLGKIDEQRLAQTEASQTWLMFYMTY